MANNLLLESGSTVLLESASALQREDGTAGAAVYIRYFDGGPGVTRHDGTGTRTNHDGQLVGAGSYEGSGP